ncbi:hypothetical protein FRC10_009165 [Ceratobasidium sp. 414]|nr:hypothetical protein FRC10_009165 [Ceratobasidium sp. 414]
MPLNSKKRGSATLSTTSRASPNPKARKILRTNDTTPDQQHPKRPRASSPAPPSSTRKRPRKSNHPPDFDYTPDGEGHRETTPTPRRVTRQSLAAEEDVEGEDPMDCLTGPGAFDSPQQSARARSTTGLDFTMDGSRLMDVEISSGGLYSDIGEDANEQAETSIARMHGGKEKERVSPASRRVSSAGSGPRASATSASRQTSTTPRRSSRSLGATRRQSKSPNVSRRTSTGTARRLSATPRGQSTTPTPRRRTEPKTLPPPVLTLTAAQARKEARLAAAQAEAEAKLRASMESEVGGLSVVGEEEEGEEQDDEGEAGEAREGGGGNAEEWRDDESEGEQSDDPLASAPVYKSPTQPPRADVSRVVTTPSGKGTPRNRSKAAVTPGNKSKRLTPRMKSTSKRIVTPSQHSASTLHVRWTLRSSGGRGVQSGSGSESGDEDGDQSGDNDVSRVSSRTRAGVATSRRSSTANTPGSTDKSGDRGMDSQVEEGHDKGLASISRGRDRSGRRGQGEGQSRSASRTRSDAGSRRQSRSASRGSPVGRGRLSISGSASRLGNVSSSTLREGNTSISASRIEPSTSASRIEPPASVSRNDSWTAASRLGSSVVSRGSSARQGAPMPKSTATTKSPMGAEVVLPAPRRSSFGGAGSQVRRPAEPDKGEQRVTLQQPTPDPSSLDRSPGLEAELNRSSERESVDPTYQPSSTQDSEPELSLEQPRDEHGRFVSRASDSIPNPLHPQKSALLDQSQRDSSVSLGSFHYEKPQRGRRTSGPKKSGLRKVSSGGNRQLDQTDNDGENTLAGEAVDASEQTLQRSITRPPDTTVLRDRGAPHSPPLNARTPRVAFESTPHHAFNFTPGSELGSRFEPSFRRFGSYAQSTPYVRGDRLSSFGRLNRAGDSSPIPTGPSDLELDGNSSEALVDRIPYSAKGKARDEHERDTVVPESPQPPDPAQSRRLSVDSSVVVATSSPGRSLRTERLSTPRAIRVSGVGDNDEEQDDGPPSPSANRQSFSERVKGRKLSDILTLRERAWSRSNFSQDASRTSSSREMTTRLDGAAKDVLRSSIRSISNWPETPGSASTATSANLSGTSKSLAAARALQMDANTSAASGDGSRTHSTSFVQGHTDTDDEGEQIVRGSVLEDHPLDKQSIHFPHPDDFGPQDYDASVHFDRSSRAPIRRSATPILRGRLAPSEHGDSDVEPDQLGERPLVDQVLRSRSTSVSADSSGPDGQPEEQELIGDEEQAGRSPIRTTRFGGYAEQDTMRYAPSPSSSARSTSRSLSRPRDYYGAGRGSILDRSHFVGDRTASLSRSQMMAEASRYEDWEPPARRQLKPRPWTDHDWRMLAHYLRRVQKSQALCRGLSSREELDLMVVNVHAVVDRFVEEEAHGIKLEGESEITGRAVYLIIKERHKKDGTWKSTALSDPSFSAVLADMTRPRAASEGPAEDLSGQRVLPAALAELPAPSRAVATQLLAGSAQNTPGDESDGHVSASVDEDESVSEDEVLGQGATSSNEPPVLERCSPKRSPKQRSAQTTAAHQRIQALRSIANPPNLTISDNSSLEADQTRPATPSTTFSRLIGSLSSIIGGRSLAQAAEPTVGFPKLKPVSRNPIDLTHTDEDEQPSFPTLNHVPTPARPTPARPKRQKHVEPKLNLPPLQHVSPLRPADPPRVPRKKLMKRVASVRELAKSFEKIGEENRKAAEAARSRIGYGRSVSGPVTGSRVATPGLAELPNNVPRPTTVRANPQKLVAQDATKDEVEVIELSDPSIVARESVEL